MGGGVSKDQTWYRNLQEIREAQTVLGLSDKQVEKLLKLFLKLDRTKSDSLTSQEFFDHCKIKKSLFAARVFAMMDFNGSGELEFGEFVCALYHYCTNNRQGLAQFGFELYDSEHTGELSVEDLDDLMSEVWGLHWETNRQAQNVGMRLRQLAGHEGSISARKFGQFCESHPNILFPAFSLQQAVVRKMGGRKFWKSIAKKRFKRFDPSVSLLGFLEELEYTAKKNKKEIGKAAAKKVAKDAAKAEKVAAKKARRNSGGGGRYRVTPEPEASSDSVAAAPQPRASGNARRGSRSNKVAPLLAPIDSGKGKGRGKGRKGRRNSAAAKLGSPSHLTRDALDQPRARRNSVGGRKRRASIGIDQLLFGGGQSANEFEEPMGTLEADRESAGSRASRGSRTSRSGKGKGKGKKGRRMSLTRQLNASSTAGGRVRRGSVEAGRRLSNASSTNNAQKQRRGSVSKVRRGSVNGGTVRRGSVQGDDDDDLITASRTAPVGRGRPRSRQRRGSRSRGTSPSMDDLEHGSLAGSRPTSRSGSRPGSRSGSRARRPSIESLPGPSLNNSRGASPEAARPVSRQRKRRGSHTQRGRLTHAALGKLFSA